MEAISNISTRDAQNGRTMGLRQHTEDILGEQMCPCPHIPLFTPPPMGFSISERLSQAESKLFRAASIGGPALAAFSDQLTNLLADIQDEIQTKKIDEKTMSLWGAASWRVLQFNEQLLDIQTTAENMISTVQTEMEALFARVGLDDVAETLPASHSRRSPQMRRSRSPNSDTQYTGMEKSSANPPYIEPAYFWLLNNLHNPYPSKAERELIVRTTGSHFKSVDAWFVDARKRIGWNALRKEHFSNKRMDIVDAATRFFLRPDENRPIDVNIGPKLAAIEERAKNLYSDRFTGSTLPSKLDVAAKDLTPVTKAQAKHDEQRRREPQQIAEDQSKLDALASASYPSPAHSPGCTPESFEISRLSNDISIHFDASAGQKRGISFMNPDIDQDTNSTDSKPRKRNRYDIPLVMQHALILY